MPYLLFNLTAIVIAGIFYTYRDVNEYRIRKQRQLRERVAYMLWAAVDRPRSKS